MEDLELLNNELKNVKNSKVLTDKDRERIFNYLVSNNSEGILLKSNLLSSFLSFAQTVGFPSTKSMIEFSLGNSKKDADIAIDALKKAKVLDTYNIAGGVMKDLIRRTWQDDKGIKKNPDKEIEVFDYDPDFIGELGLVVGKLKLQSEDKMSSKAIIQECKDVLSKLRRDLSESDDSTDDEMSFFKNLDDDIVEQLMDGLLLVVSELESQGKIKKFQKPSDAKSALLAAIRKMYQSRGLIGKEARKLQRYGSKRIMRQAKRDIQKSQ